MIEAELQRRAQRFRGIGTAVDRIPLLAGRRYRFERVSVETVYLAGEAGVLSGGVVADAQAGERMIVSSAGLEWRAGYELAPEPGSRRARFWPWSTIVEHVETAGIVLEQRDPDEIELERAEQGAPWDEMDRLAEDWVPVEQEEAGVVAGMVLEALEAAYGTEESEEEAR